MRPNLDLERGGRVCQATPPVFYQLQCPLITPSAGNKFSIMPDENNARSATSPNANVKWVIISNFSHISYNEVVSALLSIKIYCKICRNSQYWRSR